MLLASSRQKPIHGGVNVSPKLSVARRKASGFALIGLSGALEGYRARRRFLVLVLVLDCIGGRGSKTRPSARIICLTALAQPNHWSSMAEPGMGRCKQAARPHPQTACWSHALFQQQTNRRLMWSRFCRQCVRSLVPKGCVELSREAAIQNSPGF